MINSISSSDDNFAWVDCNEHDKAIKPKPKLPERRRKPKQELTGEQIQNKLEHAAKRREERIQRRSQNVAQQREHFMKLASKMKTLQKHDLAVKNKCTTSGNDNVLDKREYCKIAAEVSFGFESLSKKYENILSPLQSLAEKSK